MKASFVASIAALSASVMAMPAPQNAVSTGGNKGVTDADILNYALTLEHLENTFYMEGLKMFSHQDFVKAGFKDPFYSNLKEVSKDETTHVQFLTAGLKAAGATPVAACTYDFGVTSPQSFVMTASILEGVGVSAYLGAASSIMNKTYLTDAGSILTVESRHSAYIRQALKEVPFPSSFDVPLDFDEVYTLAAPFIKTCPSSNPALPVKAFPMLTLSTSQPMPVKQNDTVTFTGKDIPTDKTLYAGWVNVLGATFVPAKVAADGMSVSMQVPASNAGQSYVVLTTCNTEITDDTVVAGPGLVEVSGTAPY